MATVLFIEQPVLDAIATLGVPAFLVIWYILLHTPKERARAEKERKEDNEVRDKLLNHTLTISTQLGEKIDGLKDEISEMKGMIRDCMPPKPPQE